MATDAPLPSTTAEALTAWLTLKDHLRRRMTAAEWDLCIRPARLLDVLGRSAMLIALPRNGQICFKYRARQEMIRNKLASLYGVCGIQMVATNDPSEFERARIVEMGKSPIDLKFLEQWDPMPRCPECGWFCDRLGKWPVQCRSCSYIVVKNRDIGSSGDRVIGKAGA
jgi:hypothetical protein